MDILRLFKRKQTFNKQQQKNMQVINRRLSVQQEAVYRAVRNINRPVNGLAVARYMRVDSASVTPRLAELVKRDRLTVHHVRRGLDGIYRRFYVVKD